MVPGAKLAQAGPAGRSRDGDLTGGISQNADKEVLGLD